MLRVAAGGGCFFRTTTAVGRVVYSSASKLASRPFSKILRPTSSVYRTRIISHRPTSSSWSFSSTSLLYQTRNIPVSLGDHRLFVFFSTSTAPPLSDNNNTTAPPYERIHIRYASQGGTAQLFAMQLQGELEAEMMMEGRQVEVTMHAWNEFPPDQLLVPSSEENDENALYLLITSTAGVGEPPDNGRDFYNYLMSENDNSDDKTKPTKVDYAIFGLGNQAAHPNQYNAVAKAVDQKLLEQPQQYQQVLPLTLGDDGDCIEDDFDQWQEQVIQFLKGREHGPSSEAEIEIEKEANPVSSSSSPPPPPPSPSENSSSMPTLQCPGALPGHTTRLISSKHPTLRLAAADSQVVRMDLLDTTEYSHPSFYPSDATRFSIHYNASLNPDAASNGLHELQLITSSVPPQSHDGDNDNNKTLTYETGDHVLLMPRNLDCMVEAYLEVLDVHPHAVIQGTMDPSQSQTSYPYPTNLTVYETLSHCVDLGAVPSPSFSRFLFDKTTIDYKQDIALPRRTVLDCLYESGKANKIALEDLLYNLTPIQGRHYSIASSSLVHPDVIYATYRPVKYVTTRGVLREGLCTTYMQDLTEMSHIVGAVRSNPTFRLPQDPMTPIVLVAGGCGVAPIRAFLEERLHMIRHQNLQLGDAHLFLGFRNPADQVYEELVQQAIQEGAVTHEYISYSSGCEHACQSGNVSDAVRRESRVLYDLIQASGGHIYVCGGARTFGVAIENELLNLIQTHGDMNDQEASAYLQQLIQEGRLNEDLAD